MAGKKRGNFSPEFKEEAARMVVETSRSIAEVARELGVNGTTLGYWVKAYRENHAGDEPRAARVDEQLARLEQVAEAAALARLAALAGQEHQVVQDRRWVRAGSGRRSGQLWAGRGAVRADQDGRWVRAGSGRGTSP